VKIEELIIRAVAEDRVNQGTKALARRLVEAWARREAHAAARACTTAKVAKQAIASIEHHKRARRQEERELEAVKRDVWEECCGRSRLDHRGALACEACHKHVGLALEPHHLILGRRTDAVEFVMVVCHLCHRGSLYSAHRAPRWFAQNVVIPWAKFHGYPLPNRKEYRDA
jgi:hypothetical protein